MVAVAQNAFATATMTSASSPVTSNMVMILSNSAPIRMMSSDTRSIMPSRRARVQDEAKDGKIPA